MGRILIADDEANILEVMTDVLENAGHQVTGVPDGAAAMEELHKESYDVALLDVVMPKLTGYQVATQIHSLPNPPRVVIVTSRNFEGDKEVITRIGVDAFLPKPFSNQDLVNVVKNLLKKKNSP